MKYEKLVKNYQIQAPEFIRLAVSMVGAFGEKSSVFRNQTLEP
jgi:hypothetical protein